LFAFYCSYLIPEIFFSMLIYLLSAMCLQEVTAECDSIKEAMQRMAEAAVAEPAAAQKPRRKFGF
jgi:hypothetical protein